MTAPRFPTHEIGRTGLRVSELGLGTASLGNLYGPMSDADAWAILSATLEARLSYIDTAPYYGFGLSEHRIGGVLRGRHDIILSTKVGRLLRADPMTPVSAERNGFYSPLPFTAIFDYSYDGILRSYEDSLQRLGRARIDILYVHDIGTLTHGEQDAVHFEALTRGGGLRALLELRDSGAVSAVGVGVNELQACHRVMDHASLDVILLAGRYTLLEQGAHRTLFPRCEEAGTSIVIGGPYNSGILATGARTAEAGRYDYHKPPAEVIARVTAIQNVCEHFGVPLAAAALQFPLAHPAVVSVIPGIDSPARVSQTVALYSTPIPSEFWTALRDQALIEETAPVPAAPIRT